MNAVTHPLVPSAVDAAAPYEPLPIKVYDVTNSCAKFICPCCCSCMMKETLTLGDQQVKYKMKNMCGTQTSRRPYAELGEIQVNGPDCCDNANLVTELNCGPPEARDPQKPPPGWSPGCCGNAAIVQEIADQSLCPGLGMRTYPRSLGTQAPALRTLISVALYTLTIVSVPAVNQIATFVTIGIYSPTTESVLMLGWLVSPLGSCLVIYKLNGEKPCPSRGSCTLSCA